MNRRPGGAGRRRPKYNRRKSTATGKLLKFGIPVLIVLILIGGIYHYRNGILYWLGFKTDKQVEALSKEERRLENLRIYEIVARHRDKVFGIDVSHYQGRINWDSVQKGTHNFPVHFVFIRATAGKNGLDTEFERNWLQAKEHGFVRGAYHYYRPDENSLEQADNFIKSVKLIKGDLPPVLDIEQIPSGQSMDSLKEGLRRWLSRAEKHYGVKPIIYSGESYYTDFLEEEFAEYTFWIANYSFFEDEIRDEWLFWQFTDKAIVPGIEGNVDVNIFNGNLEQLNTLRGQ